MLGLFRTAGCKFSVPADDIRRLIRVRRVHDYEFLPSPVKGIVDTGDTLLPLVDPAAVFGDYAMCTEKRNSLEDAHTPGPSPDMSGTDGTTVTATDTTASSGAIEACNLVRTDTGSGGQAVQDVCGDRSGRPGRAVGVFEAVVLRLPAGDFALPVDEVISLDEETALADAPDVLAVDARSLWKRTMESLDSTSKQPAGDGSDGTGDEVRP